MELYKGDCLIESDKIESGSVDLILTDLPYGTVKGLGGDIKKYERHPTQKPVLLLEDLIKTFSNENDLVVDLTMGSGSTGVACVNTNRKFIGIEMDSKYFKIAEQRIKEAEYKLF